MPAGLLETACTVPTRQESVTLHGTVGIRLGSPIPRPPLLDRQILQAVFENHSAISPSLIVGAATMPMLGCPTAFPPLLTGL